MSSKLGRNELCRCGSGKKYKKCCIVEEIPSGIEEQIDFSWHKLRQIESEAIDKHLLPYVANTLPKEAIEAAWSEFCLKGFPSEVDEEEIHSTIFIPWVLFNWIAEDLEYKGFDSQKTIAQNYIETHGKSISREIKSFIEAMNETYYSFYSIQEVVLEKRLIVKDILLGTIHTIKERMATRSLKRGAIIFSRILTLNDQSIFVGMAPYSIPASYYSELLDYKAWLIEENYSQELNKAVLREYSLDELIWCFFDIIEELYNRPSPNLLNTDGDPILFSKSYFKISLSPSEVLEKLLPLTLSKDADDFLSDAEYNSAKEMIKIEFQWLKKGNKQHKSWDNTVMGHILVKGSRLILETNSEKRTEQGKKLLKRYLDDKIVFQKTLLETPEQKLKSTQHTSEDRQEDDELLALPQMNDPIKKMAKAHWDDWFNKKIPALNNKTPREAAKTKDGRERLEALLLQYESDDSDGNIFKADINYLKKKLNLL